MARYTGFTPATKEAVYLRSGGYCEAGRNGCQHQGLEYHHRVNRGMGCAQKSGGPEACLLLCSSCHKWITEHPEAAREYGFSVRRNGVADPAEVRVRWRKRWVLLDSAGGWSPWTGEAA